MADSISWKVFPLWLPANNNKPKWKLGAGHSRHLQFSSNFVTTWPQQKQSTEVDRNQTKANTRQTTITTNHTLPISSLQMSDKIFSSHINKNKLTFSLEVMWNAISNISYTYGISMYIQLHFYFYTFRLRLHDFPCNLWTNLPGVPGWLLLPCQNSRLNSFLTLLTTLGPVSQGFAGPARW